MILVGHQPEYLPYIGFFHKASKADKFIFVDHVQFLKKSFQNRNRIRVAPGLNGWSWLTVPVITKGKRFQRINEVEIDNSTQWGKKHWKTIYLNYKKAPFFNNYKDFFEEIYSKKWNKLQDLNEKIICYLFEKLEIKISIFRSSDYDFKGAKTDLLIEMCKKIGADTYLSGAGARESDYVEIEKFKNNKLFHIFSDFNHPVYPQRFMNTGFLPCMSVIDLLFNCGEKSINIIKGKKI
jgi:hypothetical protein